jgi:hypothetical protein
MSELTVISLPTTPTTIPITIIKKQKLNLSIEPLNAVDLIKTSEWEVKKLINDLIYKEIAPLMCNVHLQNGRYIMVELVFEEEKSMEALKLRLRQPCTPMIRSTRVSVRIQRSTEDSNITDTGEAITALERKWKQTRSLYIKSLPARMLSIDLSDSDMSAELTHCNPFWILLDELSGRVSGSSGESVVELMEVLPRSKGVGVGALLSTVIVKFTSFDACKEIASMLGYCPASDDSTTTLLQHTETKKVFRFALQPDFDDNYFGAPNRKKRKMKRDQFVKLKEELWSKITSVIDYIDKCVKDATIELKAFNIEIEGQATELENLVPEYNQDVKVLMKLLTDSADAALQVIMELTSTSSHQQLLDTLREAPSRVLKNGLSEAALKQALHDLETAENTIRRSQADLSNKISCVKEVKAKFERFYDLQRNIKSILAMNVSSNSFYKDWEARLDQVNKDCTTLQVAYNSLSFRDEMDFSSLANSILKSTKSHIAMLRKLSEKQVRLNAKFEFMVFSNDELEITDEDGRCDVSHVKDVVGDGERNAKALATCITMVQNEVAKLGIEPFLRTVKIFSRLTEEIDNTSRFVATTLHTMSEGDRLPITTQMLKKLDVLIHSFVDENIRYYFSNLKQVMTHAYSDASLKLLCHQVSAIDRVAQQVCKDIVQVESILNLRKRQVEDFQKRCKVEEESPDSIVGMIIASSSEEAAEVCDPVVMQLQSMIEYFTLAISSTQYRLARMEGYIYGQVVGDLSIVTKPLSIVNTEVSDFEETHYRVLTDSVQAFLNASSFITLAAELEQSAEQCEILLMSNEDEISASQREKYLQRERDTMVKEEKRKLLLRKIQLLQAEKEQLCREDCENKLVKKKRCDEISKKNDNSRMLTSALTARQASDTKNISTRDKRRRKNDGLHEVESGKRKKINLTDVSIRKDEAELTSQRGEIISKTQQLVSNNSIRNESFVPVANVTSGTGVTCIDKEYSLRESLLRKKLLTANKT